MNLAPVVDINNNPLNPVIGSRSYGPDPHLVCRLATSFIEAHHDAGISVCSNTFPGHGDTSVNSHYALPIIDKPLADLEAMEFTPFLQLASLTDAIMTAICLFRLLMRRIRQPGHRPF